MPPLSPAAAGDQAGRLIGSHNAEREPLDLIRRYWKGRQALPAVIPESAPREVRVMARMARVNMCQIVIDSMAQSSFVDGFRGKDKADDEEVWAVWQKNKMDARQSGIHRATYAYGAAYAVVLEGEPVPVIRGASPRALTAIYGEDPDWPMWALWKLGGGLWRLFDEEASYFVKERSSRNGGSFEHIETRPHKFGVVPVVRHLDEEDLDADDDVEPEDQHVAGGYDQPMRGQIAPIMPIQDQVDLTTFGLLVAQWYSAFRQRYAIGWVSPTEKELMDQLLSGESDDPDETAKAAAAARRMAAMQAGASQLWQFDENPENLKLGEFDQTNLDGYIKSREASMRHAATLSQTPVHELIGELINLSAEALAAAEAGRDRKMDERHTLNGESHEQTFWLVGKAMGKEISEGAQVVWRDTSARAFSATVDGLGKLVTMLGIPPQELWERVPGATQQDVERWKAAAEDGDSFKFLSDLLERQGAPNSDPPPTPAG